MLKIKNNENIYFLKCSFNTKESSQEGTQKEEDIKKTNSKMAGENRIILIIILNVNELNTN